MCGSRGGTGVRTPLLKNHKNKGFSSNIGPDPLKNRSYQASIRFAGEPMIAHLGFSSNTGPDPLKNRSYQASIRFAGEPMIANL